MSTLITETPELKLAKDAISYALNRVRDDENIRYHMGEGTEAFQRLVVAHSALTGNSEGSIKDRIFYRKLDRAAAAEVVRSIKDALDQFDNGYDDKALLIKRLREICQS